MSQPIPNRIKQLVGKRAEYRCEYCRVHQDDSNFYFHIEHIISKKHGGTDDLGNLAFPVLVVTGRKAAISEFL